MNNDWNNWVKIIRNYTKPDVRKSWWQVINTFVPYFALWVVMAYTLQYSYWITLALSVPTAGFLVRIFIIFHDCGHGSFFKSKRLSKIVGIFGGLLVFTSYHKWHTQHQMHHQSMGNLDKRGVGDVKTLTVEEFKNLSKSKQLQYRMYRNPIIIFLIAPIFLFTIGFRFPDKQLPRKINLYNHVTSLVLVALVVLVSYLIGWKTFLLIQIPVLYFATVAGVWLFYVQHQFEDVIWERAKNWDFKHVAMKGSSFMKFPKVLQWFSGNIGFHHIHHLSPKIPNYKLEKCYKENPIFQKEPLTFLTSLKCIKYSLWDEQNQQLVGFRAVR